MFAGGWDNVELWKGYRSSIIRCAAAQKVFFLPLGAAPPIQAGLNDA